MGQLVFQANAGGQTALVGPNPSTSISINIPATNGNMVTTGDSGTVTSTMLASSVYTAPGTIGSGTPNTGAFTTLSASSTVSGTGFTNYLASPPAIGGTAPNAVSATTLTLGGTQNQQLGQGNASIMKNRIINGAMVIDQRNAGASVTPAAGSPFTVDRWLFSVDQSSKMSFQQNAGSVTPPVGFSNYLGFTTVSAYTVGASETWRLEQNIEGFNTSDLNWGTANAKTVTLSFQVYSSLTGTFGGAISNSARNRSYPFSYSIPVANTWTTISITIAGDTTGTWIGATNGIGMRLEISLGTGSTLSGTAGSWAGATYISATGATSVVGTSGATFYITGVQLEVGSSATGFEYRQYGQELALCQRYYQNSNGACPIANGTAFTSTIASTYCIRFPTQMRSAPTLTSSTLGVDWGDASAAASLNATSPSLRDTTTTGTAITVSHSAVSSVSLILFVKSGGYIAFSSEL
jgi:hypothetical protein